MAILPIIQGSATKVLRTRTKPSERLTKEMKKLIKDMKETMKSVNGVGLAAPQVGQSLRLCIATIDGKPKVLINPEILSKSRQKNLDEEGCLSLPETWMPVPRCTEIVVSYRDEKWKQHEVKLRDFSARVVQHEVDHLEGKLIIDYLAESPSAPPSISASPHSNGI
jgi:peptide deformylase